MSAAALRLVEHVHGHVGWLAALALVHPALLLRRRRRAWLAATLATLLVTLTGVLGALLYHDYRATLKPAIFATAPALGWAFERKEHLATAAIVLAWAGLVAHGYGRSEREPLQSLRLAQLAYAAAALMALVSATLGVAVAAWRSF
jgi:hypothetical protein